MIQLIKRKLGQAEVKWIHRTDETRAYRMIHYMKHKQKYTRSILPADEKQNIDVKKGVEQFFDILALSKQNITLGILAYKTMLILKQKTVILRVNRLAVCKWKLINSRNLCQTK